MYSQQESILVGLNIGQCKDVCKYIFLCYFSIFLFLFLFFSTMNRFRSTALLWRLFFSHKIWIHISWKCFTSSHLFVLKNLFLNRQNYWTFWVTGYILEVMELRWFGLQWNKMVVWQRLNYLQVSENTYQYYLHSVQYYHVYLHSLCSPTQRQVTEKNYKYHICTSNFEPLFLNIVTFSTSKTS